MPHSVSLSWLLRGQDIRGSVEASPGVCHQSLSPAHRVVEAPSCVTEAGMGTSATPPGSFVDSTDAVWWGRCPEPGRREGGPAEHRGGGGRLEQAASKAVILSRPRNPRAGPTRRPRGLNVLV